MIEYFEGAEILDAQFTAVIIHHHVNGFVRSKGER